MSSSKSNTSRREFFLRGGALMGAGVASTAALMAGNGPASGDQLQQLQSQLASMADCEAIRKVHAAFASMIEKQNYETAAELFDDHASLDLSGVSATGRSAIAQLFADRYRHHTAPVIHGAYRQGDLSRDSVALHDDRQQAEANYYVDVALIIPLLGDSTVARMARLQGQTASRRWESGRLEAGYVKTEGQWKIVSLTWLAA